jgi:hypothetical protein
MEGKPMNIGLLALLFIRGKNDSSLNELWLGET